MEMNYLSARVNLKLIKLTLEHRYLLHYIKAMKIVEAKTEVCASKFVFSFFEQFLKRSKTGNTYTVFTKVNEVVNFSSDSRGRIMS
jgi:hypothetical protein